MEPQKKIMVCSLESSHNRATTAFSWSTDQEFRDFSGIAEANCEHKLQFLRACLNQSCENFKEVNGVYPDNIVIFKKNKWDIDTDDRAFSERNTAVLVCHKSPNNTADFIGTDPSHGSPYEFLVVPQDRSKPAIFPIKFTVIYDTTNLRPEEIQDITNQVMGYK